MCPSTAIIPASSLCRTVSRASPAADGRVTRPDAARSAYSGGAGRWRRQRQTGRDVSGQPTWKVVESIVRAGGTGPRTDGGGGGGFCVAIWFRGVMSPTDRQRRN